MLYGFFGIVAMICLFTQIAWVMSMLGVGIDWIELGHTPMFPVGDMVGFIDSMAVFMLVLFVLS